MGFYGKFSQGQSGAGNVGVHAEKKRKPYEKNKLL